MTTQEIPSNVPDGRQHVVNDGVAIVTKPNQTINKQKVKNSIILTSTLALVIVLLLVPIILYYSNKPTTEDDFPAVVDGINLQTCSVSYDTKYYLHTVSTFVFTYLCMHGLYV